MSKTRDALRYEVYQPRNWGRPTKVARALPPPYWGLDTERNTQAPRIGDFVCGWISNATESKPFTSFRDLEPGTYWIWNLGYDIEGLVRDLGKKEGWAMREDGTRFELDGAKCVYYHGKRFEYADEGGRRIFLEASSFYNRIPLKEAVKALCVCKCAGCVKHKGRPKEFAHCGEGEWNCPTKDPVDASKMSLKRYKCEKAYREMVDVYCARDARLAFRLLEFLRIGFEELGVAMNGTPIPIGGTPGSTARRLLRDSPPFPKVIWTTHRPFLETYCGGRFEILKRGVFPDARQYDLVSAYPWALSQCPMLTESAEKRFTRRLSDNALYGAYEISFKADEYLGVMPGWRANTRVYSAREERGWIAKPELSWLQEHGHTFEIHRGVEVFDENATDGWKQLVMPIFGGKEGHAWSCPALLDVGGCSCDPDERKARKGKPLALGAKVGVCSMYGILIQLIVKGGKWVPIEEAVNPVDFAGLLALEKGPKAFDAGQFYAPVYSSTLTSMVRVRVLDAAIEIGAEHAVASHTDSMLGTGKGRLREGSALGDWKLEKEADELIILKSGQYAIGETVKGRGFSKRKLNPQDEDEIAVRQRVDLWATEHTRRGRVGIKTANDWRDVSVIRDKVVANNIGWELKRKWESDWSAREIERRLIRGREWMDSEALRDVGSKP